MSAVPYPSVFFSERGLHLILPDAVVQMPIGSRPPQRLRITTHPSVFPSTAAASVHCAAPHPPKQLSVHRSGYPSTPSTHFFIPSIHPSIPTAFRPPQWFPVLPARLGWTGSYCMQLLPVHPSGSPFTPAAAALRPPHRSPVHPSSGSPGQRPVRRSPPRRSIGRLRPSLSSSSITGTPLKNRRDKRNLGLSNDWDITSQQWTICRRRTGISNAPGMANSARRQTGPDGCVGDDGRTRLVGSSMPTRAE